MFRRKLEIRIRFGNLFIWRGVVEEMGVDEVV